MTDAGLCRLRCERSGQAYAALALPFQAIGEGEAVQGGEIKQAGDGGPFVLCDLDEPRLSVRDIIDLYGSCQDRRLSLLPARARLPFSLLHRYPLSPPMRIRPPADALRVVLRVVLVRSLDRVSNAGLQPAQVEAQGASFRQ